MFKIIIGFITVIITAMAYWIGSGVIDHFGWLMWLAPIPILFYAFYNGKIGGFVVAFFGFALGQILSLYYLDHLLPVFLKKYYPIFAFMQGELLNALIFALLIILTVWITKRIKKWYSILFFPAAWTFYEYIISIISSAGTNGSVAYTQIHWLSLIQITSITGIWGITFLLTFIPISMVTGIYYFREMKHQAILCFLFPFFLLMAVLIYGWIQLHSVKQLESIKVGLVTVPENVKDLKTQDKNEVLKIVNRYLRIVQKASQGAQFILLPEKIVTLTPTDEKKVLDEFSKTAKFNHIYLIVGFNQPAKKRNLAIVFSPTGKIVLKYDKQELIEFGPEKNYLPGKQPGIFNFKGHQFGVAICHDFDFQRLAMVYSRKKVGVIFLPALDFVADNWLHGRIAIMRGVEGGYAIIRAAQWGLLSISDANGRIIKIGTSSFNHPVFLVSSVTIGSGNSLYARFGDWLPWCLLIIVLILLTFSVNRQR